MSGQIDMSAVTPRPWHRLTEGNRSIRSAAGLVTRDLFAVGKFDPYCTPELRDSFTDMTYIVTEDGKRNIALIGNGPKQIPNAEFLVYAANNIEPLTAERALLGIRLDHVLVERDALVKALQTILAEFVPADSEAEDVLTARAALDLAAQP